MPTRTGTKLAALVEPTAQNLPPWHGEITAMARRFYQICRSRMTEVVSEAGLTSIQYGAMLYLSKQHDVSGVEQNSLAVGLDIDRTSASLLIEQLVTKGLIERHVNAADRRARLLRLTPQGEKLRARLRPAHLAAKDEILSPLTPHEQDQFFDLLFRLIQGNLIETESGPSRGGPAVRGGTSRKA